MKKEPIWVLVNHPPPTSCAIFTPPRLLSTAHKYEIIIRYVDVIFLSICMMWTFAIRPRQTLKSFAFCPFSKDKICWEQSHKPNQIHISCDRLSRKLSASKNNFKSTYQLYRYECLFLNYVSIEASNRMYRWKVEIVCSMCVCVW